MDEKILSSPRKLRKLPPQLPPTPEAVGFEGDMRGCISLLRTEVKVEVLGDFTSGVRKGEREVYTLLEIPKTPPPMPVQKIVMETGGVKTETVAGMAKTGKLDPGKRGKDVNDASPRHPRWTAPNPLTTGGWMLMDVGGKGKEERIVVVMRGALSLQDVGILGGGGGGGVYRVEQERDGNLADILQVPLASGMDKFNVNTSSKSSHLRTRLHNKSTNTPGNQRGNTTKPGKMEKLMQEGREWNQVELV
ncbi:hypothetical protein BDZ91DRAFT_802761 [Kalaharituber pfeilii]|nr:hypothetical protein BDZ91DRAFT_802761 [Kalaharituber pfeilii]